MMKFNREEGLTLIELLITIAVLAIVAAIAVPVVTNVVSSASDRAVEQTTQDIRSFVDEYDKVGGLTFDPMTQTFTGYVDLNGDGVATDNEKIEELVIDGSTFTVEMFGDPQFQGTDSWIASDGSGAVAINMIVDMGSNESFGYAPDTNMVFDDFGDVDDYGISNWRAVAAN